MKRLGARAPGLDIFGQGLGIPEGRAAEQKPFDLSSRRAISGGRPIRWRDLTDSHQQ